MSLKYRWLGVACLEFHLDGYVLLIDPMLTRPAPWKVISWRAVTPDKELIVEHISHVDTLLISHSHYDHILDAPVVMQITGAHAYGSQNSCGLLTAYGMQQDRVQKITVGDHFTAGPFQIEVFPASHTSTPLDRWINGPLPSVKITRGLPLRLMDYRMDECFSFRIKAGEITLLVGNHPVQAEVLFIAPFQSPGDLHRIIKGVCPQVVVPIHWDNFMRSVSKPLRPMPVTRFQGWKGWLPIHPLDMKEFSRMVQKIQPNTLIKVPQIFKEENHGLD